MLQSASATLVGAKAVTYLSMSSHTGSSSAAPAAMLSPLALQRDSRREREEPNRWGGSRSSTSLQDQAYQRNNVFSPMRCWRDGLRILSPARDKLCHGCGSGCTITVCNGEREGRRVRIAPSRLGKATSECFVVKGSRCRR